MKSFTELATNKVARDMVDTAICEAIKLQRMAYDEADMQAQHQDKDCDYSKKHVYDEGVRSLCQVLWRVFGGCPAQSIAAIQTITSDNREARYFGSDSRDYVEIFMTAFQA